MTSRRPRSCRSSPSSVLPSASASPEAVTTRDPPGGSRRLPSQARATRPAEAAASPGAALAAQPAQRCYSFRGLRPRVIENSGLTDRFQRNPHTPCLEPPAAQRTSWVDLNHAVRSVGSNGVAGRFEQGEEACRSFGRSGDPIAGDGQGAWRAKAISKHPATSDSGH